MRKLSKLLLLLLIIAACESADEALGPRPIPIDDPPPPAPKDSIGPYIEITNPPVTYPNAALGPPVLPFRWRTLDGADDPDSLRWVLVYGRDRNYEYDEMLDYIRNTPDAPEWSVWHTYDPDSGEGTSWTSPPLGYGPYVFAVHGKVAGGAVTQEFDLTRNARTVLVGSGLSHYMTLTSNITDPIYGVNINMPPTIVNIPAGTPVDFCWTAREINDFHHVMFYRYGWDMVDPFQDESEWDVWLTPFDGSERCAPARTYESGTHTFLIDVLSSSGHPARISVTINFIADD